MKAIELHITGKVQGVFYRASTLELAQSLNLCGWVKNNKDGSVSAYAEGSEELISQFIQWCQSGPEHAQGQYYRNDYHQILFYHLKNFARLLAENGQVQD